MAATIDILAASPDYLVVNKPAGLLTQGPPEVDSLEARVRSWRRTQGDVSDRPYVGIPHRLDRPASGAMVIGLNRASTRDLARQFERREVDKIYWSLVAGEPDPAHGRWTDYMRKLPDEPKSEIVPADHPDAQLAVLHYRILCPSEAACLVEFRLETGRTHQIRLQASHRGHAILGDDMYGSPLAFGPPVTDRRLRPIALHARRLRFRDPAGGSPVEGQAPVSAAWREFAEFGIPLD